jgi:hypothetical protein
VWEWFRWLRRHNLDLLLKVTQGLNVEHVKGLCPTNVATLHNNLDKVYNTHHYHSSQIWNYDEFGV